MSEVSGQATESGLDPLLLLGGRAASILGELLVVALPELVFIVRGVLLLQVIILGSAREAPIVVGLVGGQEFCGTGGVAANGS